MLPTMSKQAAVISLTAEEESTLNQWLRAGTTEHRLAERARIVLLASHGQNTSQIVQDLRTRPARVSKWRQRFRAATPGRSARCGPHGQAPPL